MTAFPISYVSLVLPVATNQSALRLASILLISVVPVEEPNILGNNLHGLAETKRNFKRRQANIATSFETGIYL